LFPISRVFSIFFDKFGFFGEPDYKKSCYFFLYSNPEVQLEQEEEEAAEIVKQGMDKKTGKIIEGKPEKLAKTGEAVLSLAGDENNSGGSKTLTGAFFNLAVWGVKQMFLGGGGNSNFADPQHLAAADSFGGGGGSLLSNAFFGREELFAASHLTRFFCNPTQNDKKIQKNP